MSPIRILATLLTLALPVLLLAEADGKWLQHVSSEDRARTNPLAGQVEAVEAGKQIYLQNCARCHGPDANGRNKRPSLRSDRVRHATDGDIFWILKNGNPYKGMPPWSSLPEPQRWQIVTYLRSLPPASANP